jgi:cytochrome c-type biogenesis protein CcmH/NrfG
MAPEASVVKKQTFYITILIVFIAGFLSGVTFAIFKMSDSASVVSTPGAQQASPAGQEAQAILNLEAEVTQNPDNYNAWTQLGHLYFDSNQYNKAIGAYTKSLELHSGDANLLTDLGVMYRRSGDSAKAIESFDKAIAMSTTHEQSRFNKGIVLHFDLGKTDEAIAIWQTVLAINPNYQTGNGTSLQELINQLQEEQKNNNG